MRFYVASYIESAARVRIVRDAMIREGHSPSYDWTTHGSVHDEGLARLREVAGFEAEGVAAADVVIVLLPGGRGTHAELGMAIALRKPIVLWSEVADLLSLGERTCSFYHHELVSIVDDLAAIPREALRRARASRVEESRGSSA